MRIDLDKHVFNADCKPMREGEAPAAGAEDKRGFTTIRDVIRRALLSEASEMDGKDQPKRLSDEEKFNRFALAMKVQNAKIGEDFTEPERQKIATVSALAWPTLVYGQIVTAFVQESAAAKPVEMPAPVAANANGAQPAIN